MIVCPQCGAELSGGRFCVRCGAPLPEFPDVDASKKTSGFGAYMLDRTILFAYKIVLFTLVWVLSPKFYPGLVDRATAFFDVDENVFTMIKGVLTLLKPLFVYAIAAMICAPFKIALSVRRLQGRLSTTLGWLAAWALTILTRFWLFTFCPAGLFFLCFYDYGPNIYPKIVIAIMSFTPYAVAFAYAIELIMLWKPGVKFRDLRKSFRSV